MIGLSVDSNPPAVAIPPNIKSVAVVMVLFSTDIEYANGADWSRHVVVLFYVFWILGPKMCGF